MNLNNYNIINEDGKKIIELDLNYFIECVEENNYINNGKWSDWEDADEILDVYLDYINNIDVLDGYIITDINSVKRELNKKINNEKFKPFSKLKLYSYQKVKYCKKDVTIDLGSEIRTYFNFSAYEVVREMYKKYLITTSNINDYNIDVFLIKNDLIIREIRKEYNLNEVDMACIRQILYNTFEN